MFSPLLRCAAGWYEIAIMSVPVASAACVSAWV